MELLDYRIKGKGVFYTCRGMKKVWIVNYDIARLELIYVGHDWMNIITAVAWGINLYWFGVSFTIVVVIVVVFFLSNYTM